ncbi:MAG: polyprenyl synthetase family protein [Treponema sp.]|nr:polyprenyl synthetase family protein [Treponema sp.]
MNKEFSTRLEKIESSLNKAISLTINTDWQNASFGTLPQAVTPEHILNLVKPNQQLISLGGKRWRPLLLILCYELSAALRQNENSNNKNENITKNAVTLEQAYALTPLVEFVHTASLIHDDIEDSSQVRRGQPAAYITYGLDTALNAGSWLYFQAPVCLKTADLTPDQQLDFYNLYTNELRRLHLGQAMDIYWHREKQIFPTQDEYKAMVKCKTGTLASLAAQTGFVAGGADELTAKKAGDIAANIGIGFQIIDDVQNLTLGNPGKKRGDDIVEGKKSLPVLIHIEQHPEDKEKIATLFEKAEKEGIESSAVEECIALLEKSGSIKKAAVEGIELINTNCTLFQNFAGNAEQCSKENALKTKNTAALINELFTSMIPGGLV